MLFPCWTLCSFITLPVLQIFLPSAFPLYLTVLQVPHTRAHHMCLPPVWSYILVSSQRPPPFLFSITYHTLDYCESQYSTVTSSTRLLCNHICASCYGFLFFSRIFMHLSPYIYETHDQPQIWRHSLNFSVATFCHPKLLYNYRTLNFAHSYLVNLLIIPYNPIFCKFLPPSLYSGSSTPLCWVFIILRTTQPFWIFVSTR